MRISLVLADFQIESHNRVIGDLCQLSRLLGRSLQGHSQPVPPSLPPITAGTSLFRAMQAHLPSREASCVLSRDAGQFSYQGEG